MVYAQYLVAGDASAAILSAAHKIGLLDDDAFDLWPISWLVSGSDASILPLALSADTRIVAGPDGRAWLIVDMDRRVEAVAGIEQLGLTDHVRWGMLCMVACWSRADEKRLRLAVQGLVTSMLVTVDEGLDVEGGIILLQSSIIT